MRLGSLFYLYCVISVPIPIWAQPSFTLNGSAEIISENCYRLTSQKSPNDVGSIWAEYPTQLSHSFDIQFAINFGCANAVGEGVAFVMHNDKRKYDALGCAQASLGFGIHNNCPSFISPSIAVEFDAKYSAGHADLYVPHIAVIQNGNMQSPIHKAVRMNSNGMDIKDCEYHLVRVTWKPSTQLLQVYFDGELRVSHKGDISKVFGKEKNIYFGFTGASGTQAGSQMVCVQSVDVTIDEVFDNKRNFEEGVGIYPNPLNERLTVDLRFDSEQKVYIQLFNINGKVVFDIPKHAVKNNQYFLNLPGLPSGVYYITVSNGKNRVSRKIVHISSIRA